MAQITLTLTFLTSCLLLSSTSSSSQHDWNLLDISYALYLTHQVFIQSPPHDQTPLSTYENPSNAFSLVLRPRTYNLASFNNNYTALTLFRSLERDEARIQHLASTVSGKKLEAPVVSGVSQGIGEYFALIGLGTPVQYKTQIVDTGSDISWVQCKPCSKCYKQSDPLFDPKASSTYMPLSCGSPLCQRCRSGVCTYQVLYGDGSNTTGTLGTDTMSFGNSGSVNNVTFGCGTDNEGLFVGSDGLMGLGGRALSLSSQINATSFSYCFVNRDSNSSSTLDFNSPPPDDSVVAGLIINPKVLTFRYVNFTGVSVAGKRVAIPGSTFEISQYGSGGVFVDSGTTLTRFPEEAYVKVRDAFKNQTRDWRSAAGLGPYDTCYVLSGSQKTMVPTVSFHFGSGGNLTLPAGNTVVPVNNAGKFCFAFAKSGGKISIIGNVQQQGIRVTYDLANKHIAFSLNKC